MTELNRDEHHLLDWLARADSSAVGECKGEALEMLFRRGMARMVESDVRGTDYARVALTDWGRATLARLGPWQGAPTAEETGT